MTETTETRRRLQVGWIMPPFFLDLPVQANDPDEVAHRIYELATDILAERSPSEQYHFSRMLLHETGRLLEARAVYAGLCFLDMDGRTSMATVVANHIPQDDGTPEEVCTSTVDALRLRHPRDDVQTVELPRGKAAVRIGSDPFLLPAESSPDGQTHVIPRNLIQAYLPLPGDPEMLVFELSTTSLEDWDLYSELFAEILKTLDWTTDQEVAEAVHLARPPQATREDVPQEQITNELTQISGLILEALNGHGRLTPTAERLTGTVCSSCWRKGLRSPCLGHHTWKLNGMPAEELATALQRAAEHLTAQEWHLETPQAPEHAILRTEEHTVTCSIEPEESTFRAEVTSVCRRVSNTTLADDFG